MNSKLIKRKENIMTTKAIKKLIQEALDTANELCYDDKCKQDLKAATNETQIANILIAARRRCYG
jgi:hypothetical protein